MTMMTAMQQHEGDGERGQSHAGGRMAVQWRHGIQVLGVHEGQRLKRVWCGQRQSERRWWWWHERQHHGEILDDRTACLQRGSVSLDHICRVSTQRTPTSPRRVLDVRHGVDEGVVDVVWKQCYRQRQRGGMAGES
jgi:hypothetical protein